MSVVYESVVEAGDRLVDDYQRGRSDSEALCQPLVIEDYGIQTMPAVSPPTWHLAHTAWFFETLLLKPFLTGYREFHPLYAQLFNSYYESLGAKHPRAERGLLSRPTVAEVYQYRAHIDEQMLHLLNQQDHPQRDEIEFRTMLGLQHEQQHQELLLTDIKHIFAYNPLRPVYRNLPSSPQSTPVAMSWVDVAGGLKKIGYGGSGFAYDNESPRHQVFLNDFRIASRPVSNGEYLDFIDAGGYQTAEFWLSDAWQMVQQQQWCAPLYWHKIDGQWLEMTLAGMRPLDLAAPVCHVSYFEAAAYARWAGRRLPTEAEWETVASQYQIQGNLREQGFLQPIAATAGEGVMQLFGDVWEWTQSPYVAYPGYRRQSGALGEYNGKFMSSQMVLRGGSCVTPGDHIRASYRNFFYPHERWQFCGIRLAEDMP